MADKLIANKDDGGVIEKYVDNGDGSWSRKVAVGGGAAGAAGYPAGAVPVAGVSSGANTPLSLTLAAVAGKTTYITGLQWSSGGATAAQFGGPTISGILGGTINFVGTIPAGAGATAAPLNMTFNPPIPASAVNTAIVVSAGAGGAGNLAQSLSAQGFQL